MCDSSNGCQGSGGRRAHPALAVIHSMISTHDNVLDCTGSLYAAARFRHFPALERDDERRAYPQSHIHRRMGKNPTEPSQSH